MTSTIDFQSVKSFFNSYSGRTRVVFADGQSATGEIANLELVSDTPAYNTPTSASTSLEDPEVTQKDERIVFLKSFTGRGPGSLAWILIVYAENLICVRPNETLMDAVVARADACQDVVACASRNDDNLLEITLVETLTRTALDVYTVCRNGTTIKTADQRLVQICRAEDVSLQSTKNASKTEQRNSFIARNVMRMFFQGTPAPLAVPDFHIARAKLKQVVVVEDEDLLGEDTPPPLMLAPRDRRADAASVLAAIQEIEDEELSSGRMSKRKRAMAESYAPEDEEEPEDYGDDDEEEDADADLVVMHTNNSSDTRVQPDPEYMGNIDVLVRAENLFNRICEILSATKQDVYKNRPVWQKAAVEALEKKKKIQKARADGTFVPPIEKTALKFPLLRTPAGKKQSREAHAVYHVLMMMDEFCETSPHTGKVKLSNFGYECMSVILHKLYDHPLRDPFRLRVKIDNDHTKTVQNGKGITVFAQLFPTQPLKKVDQGDVWTWLAKEVPGYDDSLNDAIMPLGAKLAENGNLARLYMYVGNPSAIRSELAQFPLVGLPDSYITEIVNFISSGRVPSFYKKPYKPRGRKDKKSKKTNDDQEPPKQK